MRYTEAEWAQVETEGLLRYVVAKLRATSGAVLRPRADAPLLLIARTEFWPHAGQEIVQTVWAYSQRRLLAGEPAVRGPLTVLPLFATGSPELCALLALTEFQAGTAAVPSEPVFFDLLARQVITPVAAAPTVEERAVRNEAALAAGAMNQIHQAMRDRIEDALAACRGNVRATARRLQIPYRTLWGHISRLEIDVSRFRLRPA